MKVDIERFGCNILLQDFKSMKMLFKKQWVFDEVIGEKKMYIKRKFHNSIFFFNKKDYYIVVTKTDVWNLLGFGEM